MQNGEVVFRMVTSNRKMKKKTMKVVCEFPGVTMIDVREDDRIKVAGQFDSHELTKKLRKIYKHATIIPDGEQQQNNSLVQGLVREILLPGQGRRQTDGCTIM